MTDLEHGHSPVERHYAKLLAALCRSARAKPAEQRVLVMRGIVRSIGGNGEPERTGIANLVFQELSTSDAQELSNDLSEIIESGFVTGAHPTARSSARAGFTRERRRHQSGDALSTPWLPGRERRWRS